MLSLLQPLLLVAQVCLLVALQQLLLWVLRPLLHSSGRSNRDWLLSYTAVLAAAVLRLLLLLVVVVVVAVVVVGRLLLA